MSARAFERLVRVKYERCEHHPVGETPDEMRACMEWVRSLGHEAKSLEADGFRYRSVYAQVSEYTGRSTSAWYWAEPGEWLVCISGDGRDSELDQPHDNGPDEDWFLSRDEWHEVTPASGADA